MHPDTIHGQCVWGEARDACAESRFRPEGLCQTGGDYPGNVVQGPRGGESFPQKIGASYGLGNDGTEMVGSLALIFFWYIYVLHVQQVAVDYDAMFTPTEVYEEENVKAEGAVTTNF